MAQRNHKSSSWNPPIQQKNSQFAPRPNIIQAQQDNHTPPTQEEIEKEAFEQNKFEAFALQLKEERDAIAPVEQERLGVLQAKMDDFRTQRWERRSRFDHSFVNIPLHSPDKEVSTPIQPYRVGDKQQSPQQSPETASNRGMGWIQRAFLATPASLSHPMPPLQAKLNIGQPGDKYEQEADRVASQVVKQISAPASANETLGQSVQRQEEPEQELQAKPSISHLQREVKPEDEDLQAKSILQRREAIGGGEASPDLSSAINSARGGGQPLEAGLQQSMGQAMRADFSRVRVHTDAQSDHLNQSIQAKAFTTGQDVFFRQGAYQPGSRGGQELIAHELTHVLQQNGGAVMRSLQAEGTSGTAVATTKLPTSDAMSGLIQRAIGLELEVAVPVDQLAGNELTAIRNAAGNDPTNIPTQAPLNVLVQGGRKRAVPYSRNGIKASNANYRVGIDHDPRVNTTKTPPFPYRDMNNSAIMEIITEPMADKAAFDTAMDDVDQFVVDVNTHTNNLTEHAVNPFGGGSNANIGPIDYPALGNMPKESSHNWKASVQVNIGIDMREYGSLAKWYAQSTYADPSKAEPHARGDYKRAKKNITQAVDIGRKVTDWVSKQLTKQERTQMGNLRGLRGWITHMALYMLGGKGGLPQGSTAKNITPILLKSPNDIAIHYGMTAEEEAIYLHANNREAILAKLIEETGRGDLDSTNPLAGAIVEGTPGEGSLDNLSDNSNNTLFAGQPIGGEQSVGPARTGVTVSNTGTGDRGGAVVEFRNLPGFYEPNQWRQLGYDFLRQAENRNKRSGEKPNKLSNLQGNEWG